MTTENELAGGNYEILRGRLRDAAAALRQRLKQLNCDREAVFGNIPTALLSTERVTTSHHCIPRDLVAIGNRFLFGYNIQFGLKSETSIDDVFACYRLEDLQLHAEATGWLHDDDRFVNDFSQLYRYYKDTTFSRFFVNGPFIYFVFQIGRNPTDIKVFKWRWDGEHFHYLDNRSEHELQNPPQHEFDWKRTTRDQHHYGKHPHVSIEDRLFVETVGGDLTVKVENSTETGAGIYAEPVDHADQTLDDAEIHYASLGNLVLLKVRPYQESQFRFLVFNARLNSVVRMDEIENACLLLPDDQGIIFPGGFYLQTGEHKRFDHGLEHLQYERRVAAPNGEDFLYLFYQPFTGTYIQLRYNLIRQSVETPLITSGQTFFSDGKMVAFKAHDEPQKHHAVQVWQTPFQEADSERPVDSDSLLFKIGNQELVRGMAACSEILSLIDKDDNYEGLYLDLAKRSEDVLDSYFWIDHQETQCLAEPLRDVRQAALAAVEEYEKVIRLRRDTRSQSDAVKTTTQTLVQELERGRFESIDSFVNSLAQLRQQRGQVIALRELRYVDLDLVASLETLTTEASDRLSRRCVGFLLSPDALAPYHQRVHQAADAVAEIERVAQAKGLQETIDQTAAQLELLTETVSNLQVDDATKRTEIIDGISEVFAVLNRVRSSLRARTQQLAESEGRAEFASQLKLLQQTVNGYLDVCDTPEKCDHYLTRLMILLEELEGRFAEFDEFVSELALQREGIYAALESRKVQLIEARSRRAETLMTSANRILQGIHTKAAALESVEAILAYFASDLMVEKAHGIIAQLRQMEETVRAEEVESRLKTIREDTVRQLKDRSELYENGGETIRLGRHRFGVNTQPVDLTTVVRDGELSLHLTGTQFFQPLEHHDLLAAKDLWDQQWISENPQVYRGEYLATELFELWKTSAATAGEVPGLAWVQQHMARRYAEGYAKGVHDHDAALILESLVRIDQQVGLLRHRPGVRAAATLWWQRLLEEGEKAALVRWIGGFVHVARVFSGARPAAAFRARLVDLIQRSPQAAPQETVHWLSGVFPGVTAESIADYLFEMLIAPTPMPVISSVATKWYKIFLQSMPQSDHAVWVDEVLVAHRDRPLESYVLARNWAEAFLHSRADAQDGLDPALTYRDELALLIDQGGAEAFHVVSAHVAEEIRGLVGTHPRIRSGRLVVHYHELLDRLRDYRTKVVPRFLRLGAAKHQVLLEARQSLEPDSFQPKVLTSFVRNRLIDEVYLPMIGNNLAKQIGAAGEGKRTDRSGLLLLISPPGYGKTTLMEYVANRLGIVFMKINGPTIGHGVTSLDPDEAPNAAAREEVRRINLALEMGDNVMLYLDDIQHTHPELLQKFISLCDSTRRIEGVQEGRTKTYDLRGRRFAVVMAGNPYTESGERFQIPDMLANRADVYNLGEIIGDASDAFESSYLENCLANNETLAPLVSGDPEDARQLIRAASRDTLSAAELKGNWSTDQLRSMFAVLKKLQRVRDVVLKVNRAYIRSAAQAETYRTEPPFKLQGSYRNMNRIAEKVVPVMNDAELARVIFASYEQDAQTLTTDNEANLLKLKELLGTLSAQEQQRWEAIKYAFVENLRMKGIEGDDQAAQVLRQLAAMRDGLESIRRVIAQAAAVSGEGAQQRMDERFGSLQAGLASASDRLAAVLESTAAQLQRIGEFQAANPPEQHVRVQHKVPRVMLDLIRGQFHLMQQWLHPLLEGSAVQGRELAALRARIDSTLDRYARLQAELEAANEGDP